MKLDIYSHSDLLKASTNSISQNIEAALLQKGIVGIRDVPHFEKVSRDYINAAREFSYLQEEIKKQYAPDRDAGMTEGYEIGAEWFKDQEGNWKIDDKKASYYAFVPDHDRNKWPLESNLKMPYLALGELIFKNAGLLLNVLGLNATVGIDQKKLVGYGRMLHYHKENDATNANPDWCGAHFDHGLITGLMPAYYFRNGVEVEEPEEAGLYIAAYGSHQFEKINAADKSVLLFQAGEFGQLMTNDRIHATKHIVKKAHGGIERFTFALFTDPDYDIVINSRSALAQDARYVNHKSSDGSISYRKWQDASYERYRAK